MVLQKMRKVNVIGRLMWSHSRKDYKRLLHKNHRLSLSYGKYDQKWLVPKWSQLYYDLITKSNIESRKALPIAWACSSCNSDGLSHVLDLRTCWNRQNHSKEAETDLKSQKYLHRYFFFEDDLISVSFYWQRFYLQCKEN